MEVRGGCESEGEMVQGVRRAGLMYPARLRPEEEQVAPMMSCHGRNSMSATWER